MSNDPATSPDSIKTTEPIIKPEAVAVTPTAPPVVRPAPVVQPTAVKESATLPDFEIGTNMHPTNTKLCTEIQKALGLLKDFSGTTPAQIAEGQRCFLSCIIRGLTEGTLEESLAFLSNLLATIDANSNTGECFSDMYRFREWHSLRVRHEQSIEYEQLLLILIDTANVATRKDAVKDIAFKVFYNAVKQPYKERLINIFQEFYHLD